MDDHLLGVFRTIPNGLQITDEWHYLSLIDWAKAYQETEGDKTSDQPDCLHARWLGPVMKWL